VELDGLRADSIEETYQSTVPRLSNREFYDDDDRPRVARIAPQGRPPSITVPYHDSRDRPHAAPRRGYGIRLAAFVATIALVMLAAVAGVLALAAYQPDRFSALIHEAQRLTMKEPSADGGGVEPMSAELQPTSQAPPAPAQTAQLPAPEEPPPEQAVQLPIPKVDGLVMLIRRSLNALNHGNKTNNYSVLRELSASDFQAANSGAQLSEAFTEIRNRHVDLLAVNAINPRLLREPWIDDEGRLRLSGFFPSRPEQINFDLVFKAENGRWRLFGIAVDTAMPAGDTAQSGEQFPSPPVATREAPPNTPNINRKPELPDVPTMAALARDAVVALNQANVTGNYAILRELGAPGFQQSNSGAQLANAFADLRRRQLDLGPVTVISPQFFRPPIINESGMLRMTGYFPSRPEQVNFDLAFQMVDGEWKLFGIGVNTRRLEPAAAEGGVPAANSQPPAATTAAPATVTPTPRPRPNG
jgi:hypothetical protein